MMVRLFEQRRALLFAAGAAWAACGVPGAAGAAPLSTADFGALAVRCAPAVPVTTLEAVAKAESGLDPWALRDNTTKDSETPATLQAALSDAGQWIDRGDSVDLGLMQINSANLAALGMTVRGALDPCASLAGGAAVLQSAYGGGKTSAEQQAALLMALSRYNTGSPFKGILNGYARRVIVNANAGTAEPPVSAPQTVTRAHPNAPPSWNVWATAAYAQAHGAPWLIPLAPASPTPAQAQKSMPARPAPASPAASVVATAQATPSSQQPQRTP
jgi:type IV secretion system protein VirB1